MLFGGRKRRIKSAFAGIAVVIFLLTGVTVQAASTPADTYSGQTQDFFLYVQAGENVDIDFTKVVQRSTNPADTDHVITVYRPGGVPNDTCAITAAALASTSCTFTDETAPVDGIWRVAFQRGSMLEYFSWDIVVQNGNTDIPGRIWTSLYRIAQESVPLEVDLEIWYQGEHGYQYKAQHLGYNGVGSNLEVSGIGLIQSGTTCTPLYKSVNRGATNYTLPNGSCNAGYKLFFEAPDSALPPAATRWDGATDWIVPPITNPSVDAISFTPANPGSRAGDIEVEISGYNGFAAVQVDANNNGSYTDPEDVDISTFVTSGTNTITFDGNDGNGSSIPSWQTVAIRVAAHQTAEIHFLSTDVERRHGGIEVLRLNGPLEDRDILFWDDSNFPYPDSNRCSDTPIIDATAGVASTGGIHAWTNDAPCTSFGNFNNGLNGSWGDDRIIDEWTYVATDAAATYTLAGIPVEPVDPPEQNEEEAAPRSSSDLAATGVNRRALIIAGSVALGGAVIIGSRLYETRRS